MRLNRYLASCGLGSRRSCEELVRQGRVFINGQVVTELATRVNDGDVVQVDGRKQKSATATTVLLNKPAGYLCSREDETGQARETIYKLLPPHFQTLHYVGRLDRESEGLILLTNSGALTEKLTHPRFGVEKEYLVALDRPFKPEDRSAMLDGFAIEGGFAKTIAVDIEGPRVIALVLTQGIKRQIRLMFEHLGYSVRRLQRIRIGGLTMPGLKSGRWRVLNEAEIKLLFEERRTPVRRSAGGSAMKQRR
ncbi:MAG: pseudouridine synthase [Verrucomicrobiales bacterium]